MKSWFLKEEDSQLKNCAKLKLYHLMIQKLAGQLVLREELNQVHLSVAYSQSTQVLATS
jgi:hypothetical protein